MLPHDFNVFTDLDRAGLPKSQNMVGRWGNQFVKRVHSPEHLVETGISRFLQAAKVPHAPVSYSFRNGDHLVHSPWFDAKSLTKIEPADLERVHPQRALHLLTAEWLANVFDRHGGNYALHPEHGVVPLDFGLTGKLPILSGPGWPAGMVDDQKHLHSSALLHLLKRQGLVKPGTPIPEATVKHLRSVASELDAHHAAAMAGYDEDHREPHRKAFRDRFKHLLSVPAPTLAHLLEYEPKS